MTDLVPQPDSLLHLSDLALTPLDAGDGAPPTRWAELGPLFGGGGAAVTAGVWEMEPGVAVDTEAEEAFVVLSGAGTIAFLDTGAELAIGPGDLVRLAAGSRTRWTVTRTLRKLYLAP
jgi:uncharacterized cupin superfamily protein